MSVEEIRNKYVMDCMNEMETLKQSKKNIMKSGKYKDETIDDVIEKDLMKVYKLYNNNNNKNILGVNGLRYFYLLLIKDNNKLWNECKSQESKIKKVKTLKHQPVVNMESKTESVKEPIYKTKVEVIDVNSEKYIFEHSTVQEWNEWKKKQYELEKTI